MYERRYLEQCIFKCGKKWKQEYKRKLQQDLTDEAEALDDEVIEAV